MFRCVGFGVGFLKMDKVVSDVLASARIGGG